MARRKSKSSVQQRKSKRRVVAKSKPRKTQSVQKKETKKTVRAVSRASKKTGHALGKLIERGARNIARGRKRAAKAKTKAQAASAKSRKMTTGINRLIKAGIIKPGTKAANVKGNKKLQAALRDFKPVAEGKATALNLSTKAWRDYYKEQGRVVKSTGGKAFVLLDNQPDHKYSVDERGIKTSRIGGRYEHIELPIPKRSLEKFLHDLEFDKRLEQLKAPKEKWAFRFYGNNSRRIFPSLRALVDYISQYQTVDHAIEKRKNRAEILAAIEIVRVNAKLDDDKWRQQPNKSRDFKAQNTEYKRRVNKAGRNENRQYKPRPNRWAKLKETRPLLYQDQLRAARNRMRKLRKKAKRK